MKRWVAILGLVVLAACESDPTRPDATWTVSGTGNTVIDVPDYVSRVTIFGTFSGTSSNFIIWCDGDLLVNEIIGTTRQPPTYLGTHLLEAECETMEVENSSGVAWTITEVR